MAERHIQLDVTDGALEWVARMGYDPSFGARPLKRTIQQYIENSLGKMIIAGEVREGNKITVDYGDEKLAFTVKAS